MEEFLRQARILAKTTLSSLYVKELETRLNGAILPCLGETEPGSINRSTIQSYLVKRTEE